MKKPYGWLIVYFVLVPLVLNFVTIAIFTTGFDHLVLVSLGVLIVGGGMAGVISCRRQTPSAVFLAVPFAYTALMWGIFMLISNGFYGHGAWFYYGISHFFYGPIFFFTMFMGEGRLLLWSPLAYELAFIFGAIIFFLVKKTRPLFVRKHSVIVLTVIVLGMGTGFGVQWHRSKTVLPSYGFKYGGGYSSTDLSKYEVTNPNNILPTLHTTPTFTIENATDIPILDGAEAAYPVYSAFANAVYKNVNQVMGDKAEIVSFTNTIYAYERLLTGDVDIYFGAEPSKKQQEMAKKAGKELVMTPIGKEAFVFFVNKSNPVSSLDVEDIKKIYSGNITNWSDAGGRQEKIIAFQRPENSGSQTLLQKIMGNTPIMKPLKEDVPEGMGGIIEQVANYRNYSGAIGFSFRFFAVVMQGNENIKLLAINHIAPTPENIANGTYPFNANLYAITLKDNPKKTIGPFLNWMQGPQGQEIVEKIGYVKLK